ncbi:MAG: 30S ribosomal protein S2 [Candidatus Gracilibacteria bacterium]|nr:30S ribosomal protein S2 [Candidatus Gracilibacteria bacterium]
MAISLDELIQNAVHYGHRTNKWDPRMKPYLYGSVNGIHLFDLEQTKTQLEKLVAFLTKSVQEGKQILFVSTKPQTMEMIPEIAAIHGSPYVTKKWFGGLLTNFDTMKERIRYFKNLKEQQTTGELEKFTKKEQVKMLKEINKLEGALGGIQSLRRPPQVLFVVDGKRDLIAIKEARKLKIPVVGFCDSNADPRLYDLMVPANDDAMKSLTYLLNLVKETLTAVAPARPAQGAPAAKAQAKPAPAKSHLDNPLAKKPETKPAAA